MSEIEVVDRQDEVLDLVRLQEVWREAAEAILELPAGPLGSVLAKLDAVWVVLVDDAEISRVHADFLDDPSPTDVITFHHGEVIVSVETARRVGAEEGTGTFAEVLLYGIHGLVHLHGHDDQREEERCAMEALQEPLWRRLRG